MKCQCGCGRDAPIAIKTDKARGRVKGEPLRFIRGHNRRRYHGPVDEATCSRCKIGKPAADFYADSRRPNGLSSSCRECRKAENRAWYAANTEKARAQMKRWAEAHPEQANAKANRWNRANPTKRAEIQNRRRVRKKAGIVEKIDPFAIYVREGGRCHICGKRVSKSKMTLDHLIPVSKGGDHIALNVRIAHGSCNSRRGAGRLPAQLLLH